MRFREAKFPNFPGEHACGAQSSFSLSTLNCFHRSCSDAENGKECQIEIDIIKENSQFDISKNVNLLYVILV